MKILHMTPPEIHNGVYRYIFNHMPFIDLSKYEFSFLTKSAEELKKTEEYKRYHFPVYQLKVVQRNGREEFEREIRKILGKGFDAVHLHTSAWRGFMIEEIAMDMKIPKVIVHSHSSGVDEVDEAQRKKILAEHLYYKQQFSLEYATDVCACSQLAAEWLFPECVPKEKIQILPNAVDIKAFHYNEGVRSKVRNVLGISDKIVIGNIGRYSFTKNQEFLVRCFVEAYRKNNHLHMILIGQGDNISYIRKLVAQLGMKEHIYCYGWMENVADFLQAMDVFCLPSKFEGLPISVVEAQAAGLRCFVSNAVSAETDITGLVEFLPLEYEPWIDVLENATINTDRGWLDDFFDKAGYSIQASCSKLLKLYEREELYEDSRSTGAF